MTDRVAGGVTVRAVAADDPAISSLLSALTVELAGGGYTAEQTFGYSVAQLTSRGVHLVGARVVSGEVVGVGGVELANDGTGELKRFYVLPDHRGSGLADAILAALVSHARSRGASVLLLETGDQQHAAIAFYRRNGFVEIPRFGPYVDSATSVCMQRTL
jgi:putative acetyltransferase